MDAYEQLIPAGEQISYFIYFEVDPANIDVNIHPTKTEIKFENEQANLADTFSGCEWNRLENSMLYRP